MNNSIEQQYEKQYSARVAAFVREVAEIKSTGIPEPHLPLWGNNYETSALRIAFIGQDTRGWGKMDEFRDAAKQNTRNALFMHEDVFRDLLFTRWTNNFGKTFWDTAMQLLALVHNLPDWRQFKKREHDDILQTLVWAETNAVEKWGSTPRSSGADFAAWQRFKAASERHLDSFSTILDVFHPHLAIVLNWTVRDDYWDLPLQWERIGDHVAYAFEPSHATHIFHTAHSNWLRGKRRNAVFDAISRQWKSVYRAPAT